MPKPTITQLTFDKMILAINISKRADLKDVLENVGKQIFTRYVIQLNAC